MRKITFFMAMLLMTGLVSAQPELLGEFGFDGLTDVVSDCNGGENYTGSVSGRDNAVTDGKQWFRCGTKMSVSNDGEDTPNYYAVALDGGSTPLRQLVEGLTPTSIYKVSLKVSKTATNTTRPVTLTFKPFDDTNASNLSGWSEVSADANVTVNNASVNIGAAAFNSAGFTTFDFLFTAPQTNMILQIASAKEGTAGSGKDTFIDDVSMKFESTAGLEDLGQFNFSYYPNPSKYFIGLSAVSKIENVEVFGLLGKKVLSEKFNSNNGTVDVSNLAKGMYIMNVTIDGIKGSYKIVVE